MTLIDVLTLRTGLPVLTIGVVAAYLLVPAVPLCWGEHLPSLGRHTLRALDVAAALPRALADAGWQAWAAGRHARQSQAASYGTHRPNGWHRQPPRRVKASVSNRPMSGPVIDAELV